MNRPLVIAIILILALSAGVLLEKCCGLPVNISPIIKMIGNSFFIGVVLFIFGIWFLIKWMRGYGSSLQTGYWEVAVSGFFKLVPPNKASKNDRSLLLIESVVYLGLSILLMMITR